MGGFAKIFAAVPPKVLLAPPGAEFDRRLQRLCDLGVGFGAGAVPVSAFAHRNLERQQRHVIRRNAAMLPGYTFMLGLLALFGFFVIAAGIDKLPEYAAGFKLFGNNFAVPALLLHSFPAWFVGIAFAAVGIGALVPAAIMSIAAANLYTRNIHREFINKQSHRQAGIAHRQAGLAGRQGGRLVFILFVPTKYAVQLQLLGRHLDHPDAAAGDARRLFALVQFLGAPGQVGRWVRRRVPSWRSRRSSRTPIPLVVGGYTFPGYTAVYTVILNLVGRRGVDAGIQCHGGQGTPRGPDPSQRLRGLISNMS
jgi:SSS family solute:Na+ symporter